MKPGRPIYRLVLRLWPWGRRLNHLANLSLLARWLRPFFRAEDHEAIILPIQEAVRATESVILSALLLTPLEDRASFYIQDEQDLLTALLARLQARTDMGYLANASVTA